MGLYQVLAALGIADLRCQISFLPFEICGLRCRRAARSSKFPLINSGSRLPYAL